MIKNFIGINPGTATNVIGLLLTVFKRINDPLVSENQGRLKERSIDQSITFRKVMEKAKKKCVCHIYGSRKFLR